VNAIRLNHFVVALLAGFITVAGFAPWYLFPMPILALALLFGLWGRAENPRAAAGLGFVFGLGMFGAGVGWIYVALHEFGNMPMVVAIVATFLFASLLALFPALAGYLQAKIALPTVLKSALLLPVLWVCGELGRGYLFTGFPWLSLGYSQVPGSPLAAYAPVFGVYGVSLAVALSAGLLVLLVQQRGNRQGKLAAVILITLWVGAAALRMVEWTTPEGEPLKVSLLQGNIGQDEKFEEGRLVSTLETYRRMALASDARLIVLPETALPLLRSELPESYANSLRAHTQQHGSDILIGAFEQEQGSFYNSMFSLGIHESQAYRKNHLVPFGEFIPLRSVFGWFINEVLSIPMSDLASGGAHQPLLQLAGQRIAMNICYEDVFGEEIIRALPQATLLLNTSNDAWYGDSAAALQHNQISQMRALETGRMMLRATNTGVTSVIGRDGRIQQMLPQHEEGVLTATVQGYAGATPYVRWGNAAVLGILLAMLALAWWLKRRLLSPRPLAGEG
jgi:apolipoprotein N-acyltransferase